MQISRPAVALCILAAWLAAPPGPAQTDAGQPRFREPQRPGAARFEPTPGTDEATMEEIIVYGEEDEWRLPDLGSEWRRDREAQERRERGRFQAQFLPLFDPELAPRHPELFQLNKEEERVGKIELFRFKFGGKRSR